MTIPERHLRVVRPTPVEEFSTGWLVAAVLLVIVVAIGLALMDGFPPSALIEDDLTATERVLNAGTLRSW